MSFEDEYKIAHYKWVDESEIGKPFFDVLMPLIDRWYLPKPLFKDGEPVQYSETVTNDLEEIGEVTSYHYYDDGRVILGLDKGDIECPTKYDCECFTRGEQPDTLDRIHNELIRFFDDRRIRYDDRVVLLDYIERIEKVVENG
mgnify:CR=1 FL=1